MSENPYSAPLAETNIEPDEKNDLYKMDWKVFQKLYYRSCNVSGLVALMSLGVALYGGLAISTDVFNEGYALFIYALIGFYIACIIGLIGRTAWGRRLGIFVCCISLINIPIGTLIGLMGLFAFLKAPELFGEGRITHKELKETFNARKKMIKAEKKAAKRR
jgi:hypothetical protein